MKRYRYCDRSTCSLDCAGPLDVQHLVHTTVHYIVRALHGAFHRATPCIALCVT